MGDLVPFLYPDAAARSGGASFRPLLSASTDSLLSDEPVVGYRAWDASEFDLLDLRSAPPGLHQQAIETLEAQYPNTPKDLELGRGVRLAVLCDYTFSASAVLNPAEMRRLQQHLGGPGLWVTVPDQATVYAVRSDGGRRAYDALLDMTSRLFHDKERPTTSLLVSYSAWQITDGAVTGRATAPAIDTRPWYRKLF